MTNMEAKKYILFRFSSYLATGIFRASNPLILSNCFLQTQTVDTQLCT